MWFGPGWLNLQHLGERVGDLKSARSQETVFVSIGHPHLCQRFDLAY